MTTAAPEKPFLPPSRQLAYALGQMGWAILINIVGLVLVYFYLPPDNAGLPALISDRTFFVVLNAISLLAAAGHIFDGVIDPAIANWSDRTITRWGRRTPWLVAGALPAALFLFFMFVPWTRSLSGANIVWLFLMQSLFFLFLSVYVTPFSALMPELGHTPNQRLNLATWVSITYALGIVIAAQTPALADLVQSALGVVDRVNAFQAAIGILAVIATVLMYVPVLTIRERDYCDPEPSGMPMMAALRRTFRNPHFFYYVVADATYFTATTIVNTGLLYYATVLLGLSEAVASTLLTLLIIVSFVCYPAVNLLARRVGKKPMLVGALFTLSLVFVGIFFLGKYPLPPITQGILLAVLYAIPLAPMAILPNAVLGDIAEHDAQQSGIRQEGMYFGARTILQKLGVTLGIVIFAGLTAFGRNPGDDLGIRLSALVGFVFCLVAGIVFMRYNERVVVGTAEKR